jgi:hypothetical protein
LDSEAKRTELDSQFHRSVNGVARTPRNFLKTSVWLILFLWPCLTVFPQGQIVFNNRVFNVVVAPVYGLEPTNSGLFKWGNTASGTPVGAQSYAGDLLSSAGFTAQVFGGSTNLAVKDLQPLLPQTTFQTGALAGFVVPPPNAVVMDDVADGTKARLQLRCWDNRGGTITNWSQVMADLTIPRGESLPFITPPLGGSFFPPPNPIGLESFNLATGTPPVQLTIVLTDTNTAMISWPSLSVDFTLQENTNEPGGINWSNVTVTPVDVGPIKYIIVNPPEGNRFYRLFKP